MIAPPGSTTVECVTFFFSFESMREDNMRALAHHAEVHLIVNGRRAAEIPFGKLDTDTVSVLGKAALCWPCNYKIQGGDEISVVLQHNGCIVAGPHGFTLQASIQIVGECELDVL